MTSRSLDEASSWKAVGRFVQAWLVTRLTTAKPSASTAVLATYTDQADKIALGIHSGLDLGESVHGVLRARRRGFGGEVARPPHEARLSRYAVC